MLSGGDSDGDWQDGVSGVEYRRLGKHPEEGSKEKLVQSGRYDS